MSNSNERRIVLEELSASPEEIRVLSEHLSNLAVSYGIALSGIQSECCVRYLLFILQINSYINLTSIRDVDEALVLHLLDSLLFTCGAPQSMGRFLDMGTGGGFPGVPFCLATGCDGVLIDSVAKKVNAVAAVSDKLGIDGIETVHDRLEAYAASHQSAFDVVLARALAPLPVLVEYGAPFLRSKGRLIVSKGTPSDEEIASGDTAAQICGLQRCETLEFILPSGYGQRVLLVYERISMPLIKLPRAVGLAKKSPLA